MSYNLLLLQLLFAIVGLYLLWQTIAYFRRRMQYQKLRAMPFPKSYKSILQTLPHYQVLSATDKERLQFLLLLFIDNKAFTGVKMVLTDEIKVIIAFYACLMRLGFDLGEKDNVRTIIVYPKHFIVKESYNNGGIKHNETLVLEGQSANGTVAISWQDIKQTIAEKEKENVIIHEFAHELDFEDGLADGTPILEGSNYKKWSEVFSKAFDRLYKQMEKGESSEDIALLGSYALTNEAEFFAVCSERFFQTPTLFKTYFPNIYQELKLFYRLDTIVLFKDLS